MRSFLIVAVLLFIVAGWGAAPSMPGPRDAGWLRRVTTFFATRSIMAETGAGYSARIEQAQYRRWNVYKLSNGLVALYIAPQLGGRAIQVQLGDHEYFFVNKALEGKVLPESENNLKAGWANYGGDKAWPGPEGWLNDGEWPSIPYYILDGATHQAEVITNNASEVALRVTSPKDPRSGTQFIRTFHVYADSTRIKVDQVMRNISRREIRWGIWHLIQNDGADANDPSKPNPDLYMYIPLNPYSKYPEGYYKPYGDARHPSYEVIDGGRMLKVHYLYRVCKAAADSSAGWYAVVNGQKNIGLVENFKYFPNQEYPDGASIETWNDGPGTISRGPFDQVLADDPEKTPYFLESEGMSPYARLEPGEEYSYPFCWSLTRVPNPISGEPTSGGVVSEPLAAKLDGTTVALKGTFGVFTPGTLQADFYSVMGEELGHVTLQAVDPREVVKLDKTVPCPPNAFRVSVSARDRDGENRGFLGNVILRPRRS
ncbi:MAG TPA: DUF4380 domain-containing protein [Terriglobia bacterium]|nr:DUF4380 domain-containing protein [Terriglobia bacterium]